MQQFPSYSMNPQMNPYQNFNPYNTMQDFYANRMNQMQQQFQQPQPMQVQNQPQGIIGKTVNDFSEITADDIPMNGTPAVFVKNDMSEIEIRVWGKDGLIRPTTYKPILEENHQEGTNTPQMDFNSLNEDVRALREDILSRLDNIEKSIVKPNGSRGKKSEVSADE